MDNRVVLECKHLVLSRPNWNINSHFTPYQGKKYLIFHSIDSQRVRNTISNRTGPNFLFHQCFTLYLHNIDILPLYIPFNRPKPYQCTNWANYAQLH